MSQRRYKSRSLSQLDAFFVAYQETSGILMQLGVEIQMKGTLRKSDLEAMLAEIVTRWPQLGQVLHKKLFGMSWSGEPRISEMLRVAGANDSLSQWRNKTIDPFQEPPFQLLWIPDNEINVLAFRAHHAVTDGQAFFAVCVEAVRALPQVKHHSDPHPIAGGKPLSLNKAIGPLHLLREGKLPGMVTYTRELVRESRADRSARLAVRTCTPGDTAIAELTLEREAFRSLKERAASIGVAPAWICAAAWMKSIYAWNSSSGDHAKSLVSLETPVSLRRRQHKGDHVGNFISPVMLFGDATASLEELAQSLKKQLKKAIRERAFLAVPLFTMPGKYLPWSLFRRMATGPAMTGFATSHFSWFEQDGNIHREIQKATSGGLQITGQQIYTPVCLHMGAALAVLAWPERAQILVTYRETALSQTDALTLLDLMIGELSDSYATRQQVAV